MSRSPPLMGKNLKILLPLLAVSVVILAANEVFIFSEANPGNSVRIETDPDPFPQWVLGVPFDFQVTVVQDNDKHKEVHLSLHAACPGGGVALLTADAVGNACDGPIETSSKDLNSGPARWVFTVEYQGSTGSYKWTIEAHGDEDEDDDCGPGFWKNHPALWDGDGVDDVTTFETEDTFNDVFGVTQAFSDLADDVTLRVALAVSGGELMALNRHAVAALLNADSLPYPLTVEEVIALYQDGVGLPVDPGLHTIASAHETFASHNEDFECTLGGGPADPLGPIVEALSSSLSSISQTPMSWVLGLLLSVFAGILIAYRRRRH